MSALSRGSEWRRWDPHIHAPGTVLADAFSSPTAWKDYLDKLEQATPTIRAIGVTDYGVTASYERLVQEKTAGRLPSCDLLFPNIELRLNIGTVKGHFVNIHLLVCPDDPNHLSELKRFLSKLEFNAFDDKFVCTPEELIRLGRRANSSLTEDKDALAHGFTQFKVSLDNLLKTMREMEWAAANILIAASGNDDGTSGVRDAADVTLREEIEKASHAIFASSARQRDFWLGRGAASLDDLHERWGGPKPCIWGSDAHDQDRVGNPDDGRLCWVKGAAAFDTLRQACIDPERVYVGDEPPQGATPSQTIDEVSLQNAPWMQTPAVPLNPGLVAVIGARGSGKTALADVIAAGADSYQATERPSFLARAAEHLDGAKVTLKWATGSTTVGRLDEPVSDEWDSYPRARYLSQQFVEDLCSIEGMPKLIQEIERVIFDAHDDKRGAADFQELLAHRVGEHRATRSLEEDAIATMSEQIGVEMDKWRQVSALTTQVSESQRRIKAYEEDRKRLLPKGPSTASDRLQMMVAAADTVRGYLRAFTNRQTVLSGLATEVRDVRVNRAPHTLKLLREKFQQSGLGEPDWKEFLLTYSGDVEAIVAARTKSAKDSAIASQGTKPTQAAEPDGSYLAKGADPVKTPLATLEAEIERLQKLVATDTDTARKLAAISKKISDETINLRRLEVTLADYNGAKQRAEQLHTEREESYKRVFEAIVSEETILRELYAPLMAKLDAGGKTLRKIAFTLSRVADIEKWADSGEELFDLRTGTFKGSGTIEKEARAMLEAAWVSGDAEAASKAMAAFLQKHQQDLLGSSPYERTDPAKYRPWTRRFAQWLYGTAHISLHYGITHGGIDIQKLSPGTRGIVLLLLYLALDDADDRPLVIDQPEENLDPQSVNDELVPLFQTAKARRQVIMVTHNANLVVNADADQVIIANVDAGTGTGLPNITYVSGGLEEESIRKQVCSILEGGDTAFKERARRLRIALRRQP